MDNNVVNQGRVFTISSYQARVRPATQGLRHTPPATWTSAEHHVNAKQMRLKYWQSVAYVLEVALEGGQDRILVLAVGSN
jgi:hypothetical protein